MTVHVRLPTTDAAERARRRGATFAAACVALCFFLAAERLRAMLAPARAFVEVTAVHGAPDFAAALLRWRLRDELIRRGVHDDAAGRVVRVEVWVTVGAASPADGTRPVQLYWEVRDGRGRLGTVEQSNRVPDDLKALWRALGGQATDAAASGVAKLARR